MRIKVRKLVNKDLDGQNTRNIPWYKIAINPARQCPPRSPPCRFRGVKRSWDSQDGGVGEGGEEGER